MRFVLAIVSFVIGVLLVGLGVGQRTVFAPPTSIVAATSGTNAAPVTVLPGSVLNANPGYQRVNVSGSGKVFAAYGKTSDVDAWIGDAEHTTLRYDADDASLQSRTTGSGSDLPDPKGSDLWYQEYDDARQFTVRLPADVSLVVMGDGSDAAPSDISVTWPRDTATPSVGPLLTAGGVFVLGGLVLLVWAFLHQRRSRGPRRRSGGRAPAARACVPSRRRGRSPGAGPQPTWSPRDHRRAGARRRCTRVERLLLGVLADRRWRGRHPDPDRHGDRCRCRGHLDRRDEAADRPHRVPRGRGRREGRRRQGRGPRRHPLHRSGARDPQGELHHPRQRRQGAGPARR
ncbi:hypothetical protein [Curtobacterium sp. MCPF17_052]|uniref:hypothetical protein n=1 Tax=Curtobacterium sp. MCPF17_052 TaxID=2175655 RepID=UPI0024DF8177|nr:hypothetical protein [Curtobacterium sp. MCPF17_052]WIB12893.1 hypothetical protein DEJ36_02350 [Curtobacterium sp. MCPF17_052]